MSRASFLACSSWVSIWTKKLPTLASSWVSSWVTLGFAAPWHLHTKTFQLPSSWVSFWVTFLSEFLSFWEPKGRCGDTIHKGNIGLVARRVRCGGLRYCVFVALILSNFDFSGTSNFRNFLPRFIGWVGTLASCVLRQEDLSLSGSCL